MIIIKKYFYNNLDFLLQKKNFHKKQNIKLYRILNSDK